MSDSYILSSAVPDMSGGDRVVQQAVKDTFLLVKSLLGGGGQSLAPGLSGTPDGEAVPSALRESKLVSSAASVAQNWLGRLASAQAQRWDMTCGRLLRQ